MNLSKEQKLKIYLAIPEEVRVVMSSESTANMVVDMVKRNGVPSEKISIVSEEIGNVMLGISDIKDFSTTIVRRLGLDQAKAEEIKKVTELTILGSIKIQLIKAREIAGRIIKDLERAAPSQVTPEKITQKIVSEGLGGQTTQVPRTPTNTPRSTSPDQIPETHPYHLLEKAKILSEIERPRPVTPTAPRPPVSNTQARPTNQSFTPPPIRTLQKDFEKGKTEGTFTNIISQKLTGPTTISQVEKVLPATKPLATNRIVDPYREAI